MLSKNVPTVLCVETELLYYQYGAKYSISFCVFCPNHFLTEVCNSSANLKSIENLQKKHCIV